MVGEGGGGERRVFLGEGVLDGDRHTQLCKKSHANNRKWFVLIGCHR